MHKKREKTALSHLPPWGKTSEAESPAPIRKGRPAHLIAGQRRISMQKNNLITEDVYLPSL